jgi:hypothetical protein
MTQITQISQNKRSIKSIVSAVGDSATWTAQYNEIMTCIDSCMIQANQDDGIGMLIIGRAGAGKTHLIRTLQKLPEFAPVVKEHCTTLPILSVTAPNVSNEGALVEELLEAIGANNGRLGKIPEKTKRLYRLIEEREVKLVIIDEAHDYIPTAKYGTNRMPKSLNFIKKLMDNMRIPLLLVGTEDLSRITEFRCEASGKTELRLRLIDRYDLRGLSYGIDKSYKAELAGIVDSYFNKLTHKPKLLHFLDSDKAKNTALLDRIYLTVNGNFRLLRQFIISVIIFVEEKGDITLADLHSIRAKQSANNEENIDAFVTSRSNVIKRLRQLLDKTGQRRAV